MTRSDDQPRVRAPISLAALPELPTRIGMAGAMRHAEVGGASFSDSAVVIATVIFNLSDR